MPRTRLPESDERPTADRGPLTGGTATGGFWALMGGIAGVLVAGGLFVRTQPGVAVTALMLVVLPGYGALLGMLAHRFRAALAGGAGRILMGCLAGFGGAAALHALGLLPRGAVPFGVVAGSGLAFVLVHRERQP